MPVDEDMRRAILKLAGQGRAIRTIATSLGVGRNTVRRIVRSGRAQPPPLSRQQRAHPHEPRIRELFERCEGSRQRVHEELAREGIAIPYATLTGYLRRHGIGVVSKPPAGQYLFLPGEEMQHDTSPHTPVVGGQRVRVQCASLVLCYSRRRFLRVYRRWTRFEAKLFITAALKRFGAAAGRCMVDNASIIVARGSGKDAVMAPEMVAFARNFGFVFAAHELGDADRSAHVERSFQHVETSFYKGRTFVDLADLNAQFEAWCDADDVRPRRHLGGVRPLELFATEQPAMRPLPLYVPEPSLRWQRTVDAEGYVHLHNNRYSAPVDLLEREVIVYETHDRVRIFDRRCCRAEHPLREPYGRARSLLPEHDAQYRAARVQPQRKVPRPEESRLSRASPALARLVEALKARHGGRATRVLRRLDRMWKEYPAEPLAAAVERALAHGLTDLDRIETMVLQHVAGDFFRLPSVDDEHDADEPDEHDPR